MRILSVYGILLATLVAALFLLPALAAKTSSSLYVTPGKIFRDCADCPEMVVIPAGSYRMGDLNGGGRDREDPVHRVTIPTPFAVGKYEVTRDAYAAFARSTGRGSGDGCYVWNAQKWVKEGSKSWRNPGYVQTNRHPVACVNWDDAKAYVAWMSAKTGKAYRLLSESEWEYAARAGSRSKYSWGNSISSSQAKYRQNINKTTSVGSYAANSFGLHDMHGNVWEWVEDCWNRNYNGATSNGTASTAGNCFRRVLRGGSWVSGPRSLRSASRSWGNIAQRFSSNGFRVSRTLSR